MLPLPLNYTQPAFVTDHISPKAGEQLPSFTGFSASSSICLCSTLSKRDLLQVGGIGDGPLALGLLDPPLVIWVVYFTPLLFVSHRVHHMN